MWPGSTESCVWPQMPEMMRLLESSGSETAMSQVDVPMTLTRMPGRMPAPMAPMWQSIAPIPTAMGWLMPKRFDHSCESIPTRVPLGTVLLYRWPSKSFSSGSTRSRNSASGSPCHCSCHIALWPAVQRLRRMRSGEVSPTSSAQSQSQCSAHDQAACCSRGVWRRQCSIFDQTHSHE